MPLQIHGTVFPLGIETSLQHAQIMCLIMELCPPITDSDNVLPLQGSDCIIMELCSPLQIEKIKQLCPFCCPFSCHWPRTRSTRCSVLVWTGTFFFFGVDGVLAAPFFFFGVDGVVSAPFFFFGVDDVLAAPFFLQ